MRRPLDPARMPGHATSGGWMRRVRLLAAMVTIGAVLLTGCGSDDGAESTDTEGAAETVPPGEESEPGTDTGSEPDDDSLDGTSGGGVDACAIVETLAVEELLGEAPAPQDDASSDLGAVCVVKAADPESRGTMRLVLETERGPENYEQQKEMLGVDSEPAGFGDQAFHTGPYLFVLKGDTLAFIQVVRDSSKGVAVEDAQLEAAMSTVLESLDA